MWHDRTARRRSDTSRNNIGNHNKPKKKKKTSGSRLPWTVFGIGICAGSFLVCFVVPLLGRDSLPIVDGFVTTAKPQLQQRVSLSENDERLAISSATSPMLAKKEENDEESPPLKPSSIPLESIFYRPSDPSDFETFGFESNPTVFGSILRGELPTKFLFETNQLISFEDIRPRAPFHALVIPKTLIPSVLDLDANDNESLALLERMSVMAHDLVQREQPEAYRIGDYRLCFHIPPFNSVDHLHLHVLAPASAMAPWYKNGKYNTGVVDTSAAKDEETETEQPFGVRWCIALSQVEANLRKGSPPTPYSRSDSWGTILSDLVASIRLILSSSFESE